MSWLRRQGEPPQIAIGVRECAYALHHGHSGKCNSRYQCVAYVEGVSASSHTSVLPPITNGGISMTDLEGCDQARSIRVRISWVSGSGHYLLASGAFEKS